MRGKLRWAFWLLLPLGAHATAMTVIATQNLPPQMRINAPLAASMICGLVVNLICSPLAGYHYARYHKPASWRASHVLGWTVLFFGLNIMLLPAGCGIGALVGHAIAK